MSTAINNLVVVGDLHCGCQLGLCPPDGAALDDGGLYQPSHFQQKVWEWWQEFWGEHVPLMVKREPYAVVNMGDALEGIHHGAVTQISHNLHDQTMLAAKVLQPVVALCEGRYYHLRGTEAHVGPSAQEEEGLARQLGAIPNAEGRYARYQLWKTIGPRLAHLLHHIGVVGSQAYETTAVHRELTESYVEAARWSRRPPDIIVRAHRHRHVETSIPTAQGYARAVVCPGWQGKTPYVWRLPGGRLVEPQFGGIVIRYHDGELFVRSKVWSLSREEPE